MHPYIDLYTLYMFSLQCIYILYTFFIVWGHFLDALWTLVGHVPGKFGGRKKVLPRKFWGCLGCIWASSLVSKKRSRGSKNSFFLLRLNMSRIAPMIILRKSEYSYLSHRADFCIFLFFQILFFHIFRIYSLFMSDILNPGRCISEQTHSAHEVFC